VGLCETFGVSFEEFVTQPSLAFTAEALRRDEIDVGLMFSTSAELNAPDLVELLDDRRLQPPENVVPMLRRDSLERWGPELVAALDGISDRLTTLDLRRLNGLVADGAAVEDVARDWLTSPE
jgi:osmoprotectant transport system substrate-binding protein